MSDKPEEPTGYEPQLGGSSSTGMEPQLGGEQRQDYHLKPTLLRFSTQIGGEAGLTYRLQDLRSRTTLVQIQEMGEIKHPLVPVKQNVTVRGKDYVFQTTGLSARLTGPQVRWHIDYVRGLSSPTRLEWALRDASGMPQGVMRLNKAMGWLEIIGAENQKICKTTIAPHHAGIEEIIFGTDRLLPAQEPLFLVALLFGLMVAQEQGQGPAA